MRRKPELEIVVAHELGHRRHGDVAKGTVLAMLSAAVAVLVAWPLDPTPRRIPLLLLVWGVLELVSLPFTAAFSRRLERRRGPLRPRPDARRLGIRVGVSPDGKRKSVRPRSAAARLRVHVHASDSGGTHRRREGMSHHHHDHRHAADRRALTIALVLIVAFLDRRGRRRGGRRIARAARRRRPHARRCRSARVRALRGDSGGAARAGTVDVRLQAPRDPRRGR